jgi:hypothetical protein
MSVQPVVSLPQAEGSRKVWVLNRWTEPYRENFKGREIVVPPNGKKELLMPVLEANRFLSRPAVIVTSQEIRPDGTYPVIPKALYIQELSVEERADMEGKPVETIEKEQKEAASLKMCSVCGDSFKNEAGLKIHLGRAHPEYVPLKEE